MVTKVKMRTNKGVWSCGNHFHNFCIHRGSLRSSWIIFVACLWSSKSWFGWGFQLSEITKKYIFMRFATFDFRRWYTLYWVKFK